MTLSRWIGWSLMAGSCAVQAWDDTRRMTASPPVCSAGAECKASVVPGVMAGQVSLDFSGKAPALAGQNVAVRVLDSAGAAVSERSRLVSSTGSLSVQVASGQTLQPGRYRYVIEGMARGQFEIVSGAAAKGSQTASASPPSPASSGVAVAAALPGRWFGITGTPGSIELGADGTYKFNGSAGGRYRQEGQEVVFDGALATWNKGRATLKNGVLEFQWKSPEGFNNWFVYQRGN